MTRLEIKPACRAVAAVEAAGMGPAVDEDSSKMPWLKKMTLLRFFMKLMVSPPVITSVLMKGCPIIQNFCQQRRTWGYAKLLQGQPTVLGLDQAYQWLGYPSKI